MLSAIGLLASILGWGASAQAFLVSATIHVGLFSALLLATRFGGDDENVVVMRRGQIVIEATYSPGQPERRPEPETSDADTLDAPALPIVVQPEQATMGERRLMLAPSTAPDERRAEKPTVSQLTTNRGAASADDKAAEISAAETIVSIEPPLQVTAETLPRAHGVTYSPRKTLAGPPQPEIPELLGGNPTAEGIDDSSLPELEGNAAPTYPPAAYRDGLEGAVTLRLRISARGAVTAVEVVRSSGHDILDEAAVNAARRFRAKPARRHGQPIARDVKIDIQFKL